MTFEEAKNLYLQAQADLDKAKPMEEALGRNLVKEFNCRPNSALALRCHYYLQCSDKEKKAQAANIIKDLKLILGGTAKIEIEHIYSCGWNTYGYSIEFKRGLKSYSITFPKFGNAESIDDVKYAGYGRWTLCLMGENRVYTLIAAGNNADGLTEAYDKYKKEQGKK